MDSEEFYERFGDEKQAELNLYFCGRDENLHPGAKYGPVIRDAYIVECCTGGYGSIIINWREFPVSGGMCYILRPGDVVIHTAAETEPRSGVWCAVKGNAIEHYLRAAGISSEAPFAPKEAFAAITEEIEQILKLESDTDSGAELRRNAHLHMLFGELMRYAPKETQGSRYVRKAIHMMEMHYSEHLTVQNIAEELGLERCYFSNLFSKSTGQTPHAYLSKLRIHRACMLLGEDELTIAEIARAVGIEPISFARVFREKTGMLPGQYRAERKQQPQTAKHGPQIV